MSDQKSGFHEWNPCTPKHVQVIKNRLTELNILKIFLEVKLSAKRTDHYSCGTIWETNQMPVGDHPHSPSGRGSKWKGIVNVTREVHFHAYPSLFDPFMVSVIFTVSTLTVVTRRSRSITVSLWSAKR